MKSKILVSVMMVAGLFLATISSNNLMAQTVKEKTEMVKAKKYYCPHHPDQVSDKPGKCAVCGMDMVEMKDMGKDHDMKNMKMDKDNMKMDKDKMEMDKDKMKGDVKKMETKMKKDSKDMKMDMKEMKKDTAKMMEKKM